MMLAFGILAALNAVSRTGKGQIVDCSMVEGSATLMTMIYSLRKQGAWFDRRGANIIDGGAPYYDTYETLDGRYVAIGAVEPQFFATLLRLTGLTDDPLFKHQEMVSQWPAQKERLTEVFLAKTREEWCTIFEGTDACFAPVLSLDEAPTHPQNMHRGTFQDAAEQQPAPAPRICDTPARSPQPLRFDEATTNEILGELGYSDDRISELRAAAAIT